MPKTVSLLLLLSLSLLGCATTSHPSNAQMIRGLYDSFAKGDVPAVMAAFDPQISWNEAESLPTFSEKNPYRGPQAILNGVFMRIPQVWDNFRITVENVVDGGDSVVVLGRYSGVGKATGQPLNAQFAHVWTVRDGKITSFQQYTDTAQMARVSGLK
jgi:ketosteroid isomerase-like protein